MASTSLSLSLSLRLRERWRSIEDQLDADVDPDHRHLLPAKTCWFSDAFDFLIEVPEAKHIWCEYPDLMGPLLETFHDFFKEKEKEKEKEGALPLLWSRISRELGLCTQCVCQHHQALHSYSTDYQSDSVGPLLQTLRRLDEERVTHHLKQINAKLRDKQYDPNRDSDSAEVVALMFEVLMYPILLDDRLLAEEFQIFIEAIDNCHQLTLSNDQYYPGVFALLFFSSGKARAIGLRLARCMGKLRLASDLEPLQPLLKKWIGFLETDVLPTGNETLRPRVQLKRADVWLGIKSLLGFLDGPAFEDGLLERYPVFLGIILNHVSDDTSDFSYAISCLKASFEMLGCKLWLRASLSPSVMRNTLLGHCFHTRDEKSHKDIFDLFIPFLQSLEALQDGEHEKQRRNILYFLLHQVTRSSNFSAFTRQNASKIAILIVHRGYTMAPPSPPFECAHMWGPSLVSSLKDTALHSSLRQPAFELINSIIISDACALVSKCLSLSEADSRSLFDEEEDTSFLKDTERDKSCWAEFCSQWNLTSRECSKWRCIPLLWYIAMFQIDPMVLPISCSMALFWVLSRVSVVDLGSSNELVSLSVDEWLVSHAGEISCCFKWEAPNGSNDGGDGKETKNSVEVAATTCTLLTRVLKRLLVQFVVQLEKRGLQRQWNWVPAMAESLLLLLVDPNDSIRQAARAILEHVSNKRTLTDGLRFLCSSASSLSAMYLGLRYVIELVQVDPISQNFHHLHQIFFVARKLLKEVVNPDQSPPGLHKGPSVTVKPLTEGGFLRQPGLSDLSNRPAQSTTCLVDMKSWENFCYVLSTTMWPFIVKCLEKGGMIFDAKHCEMACVRLFETLPCVVGWLCLGLSSTREGNTHAELPFQDLTWLSQLANWGKSSLLVLARHWKESIVAVLKILRGSLMTGPTKLLSALEAMACKEKIDMGKFLETASACEASALRKEAPPVTTIPPAPLLDPIATERAPPSRDKSHPVVLSDDKYEEKLVQEVRRPSTKLETDKLSSSDRNSTLRPEPTTAGSTVRNTTHRPELTTAVSTHMGPKPTPLEGVSKGKKPIKPSMAAETAAARAMKPTEPAAAKGESLLKQIVQEHQPDSLDVALDKARRAPVPLPLTKTLPLPPKRQVVPLAVPNGNRNAPFGNRNTTVARRFQRPKFDQWYKEILQLDYFSLVGISENGQKEKGPNVSLKKVPLSFDSESHYLQIFRPLVLEEFKAQLHAAYMESSVDDMACGSFCVVSVERVDEFLVVRGWPDEKVFVRNKEGCFENDLVLLTKDPFKKADQSVHALGKVDMRERGEKNESTILVIRFLISNDHIRFNRVRKLLTPRSKWFLSKVFNPTPQIREFQALSSLHDIPILPIILNPLNIPLTAAGSHKVQLDRLGGPMKRLLTSSYNDSQIQAISVAIGPPRAGKDFDLSLIQGPPGTGKTRTIVAIVSALLSSPLVPRRNSSASHLGPGNNQGRNPRNLIQSSSVARAWQGLAIAKQLMKESGLQQEASSSDGVERSVRGRVLICAQSNAAVDEILSRLSEGLVGNDGQNYKPYIVRVGNQKTVHPSSLPVFLDTLVEQKISEEMKSKEDGKAGANFELSISLRAKLESVVDNIRHYEARRAKLNSSDGEDESTSKVPVSRDKSRDIPDDAIGGMLNKLYGQKREISNELHKAHAREKRIAEENRALKKKVRKQILMDAQIVVTTLSGAGGDLYSVCSEAASPGKFGNVSENTLFDVVVIDEAAQALEPATLIPLQLLKSKGSKCVMVGDPKQLPATVISGVASKFSYECSMFERLQLAGHPVIMLTQQYRMHPEICRFPSLHFYNGKLLNGAYMEDKSAPFHEIKCLGPYMFFDVTDGQERLGRSAASPSLFNESEAEAATEILRFLKKRYPSEMLCKKIGIITPYKSQLSLIRSKFNSSFGPEAVSDMEINTVDGFQGREVDILLLSTVRASSSDKSGGSIGFVADVRRMNVALTRAKSSLWIFGNARTLQVNPHWTALIEDARERKLFASISRPYSAALSFTTGLLPDSTQKDTGMSCRGKQSEQSMTKWTGMQMPVPEREREPRSSAGMRKWTGMPMPMSGRESELSCGTGESKKRVVVDSKASLGRTLQLQRGKSTLDGAKEAANKSSSEKREHSYASQGGDSLSRRDSQPPRRVMPMPMPEKGRGTGELMKRANDVAVRGPYRSTTRSDRAGAGFLAPPLELERGKETAKKASSENREHNEPGLGGHPSKRIQTEADSTKREKRRMMPMPMPRASGGPGPSGSDRGGVEAGERKKGKVEEGSVLNSARKRRREDVESLLSSALISSKKKP